MKRIIPSVYSNVTKKNILVKHILSELDLTDLYPQIIKHMYHFSILRLFDFLGKNMRNIIEGLSYAKYVSSDFVDRICNEIDSRAIKLMIKTPENFLKFMDYCIVLFLISGNGKLGRLNSLFTIFSKLINALEFNNNKFVITWTNMGNFDATYTQTFYLERGIRTVNTYYEYKLTTKSSRQLPEKYSGSTKKIYVMYLKAHPLIDKEIKRAEKCDIFGDILVNHLKQMKKNPVMYTCEKFVKDNNFDYEMFVDFEVLKREETSTMN